MIVVRVGKTHWQGHQDPSKSVPIFLRGTEANLNMVPISGVPIPQNRTVALLCWPSTAVSIAVACGGARGSSMRIKMR